MAHEIVFDQHRGINPIAFVGEVPWHGLGQQLQPDSPLEVWAEQAGMDFDLVPSPVLYRDSEMGLVHEFPGRKLLLRNDTQYPLSIVGSDYKIVQPREVLEFYRSLIESAGFKMNTAGVLFGGKKFWALAETGLGARIQGQDKLDSYLLLASSCDGSLATTAMLTSVRVVCNNTLQMSITDGESGRAKKYLKVPHSQQFDAEAVKAEMGLAESSWTTFIDNVGVLSERTVTDREAMEWLVRVMGKLKEDEEITDELVMDSDAGSIKTVFELFKGKAIGSNLKSADGTAWGLLNAVTQWTDHNRKTRTPDNRLNSAWFGAAANLKSKAWEEALKLAA